MLAPTRTITLSTSMRTRLRRRFARALPTLVVARAVVLTHPIPQPLLCRRERSIFRHQVHLEVHLVGPISIWAVLIFGIWRGSPAITPCRPTSPNASAAG